MDSFEISNNKETFDALVEAYNEKHRRYHNVTHIEATLKHLDSVQELAEHPNEVELALWFHDAIYKTLSSTNELDSATWATDFLAENNVAEDVIVRTRNLIMATLHTGEANTSDEELMIDIDLTILGSDPRVYSQFEKNIRKEYRFVPYFLYKKKRKEILKGFLDKDRIFKSHFFYSKLEGQARANLKSAIALL